MRPFALILADYTIARAEIIDQWKSAFHSEAPEAEAIPVTTQDVYNLGGNRKIEYIVIAFTDWKNMVAHRVLQYVSDNYRGESYVHWTPEAKQAYAAHLKETAA